MQTRRRNTGLVFGLVPVLLLTLAHASAAEELQRRLLFNNDGTNLLWRDDLSMAMVEKHAAECPDAITTYLLCPNGIQKMMYPSAHEELATRGRLPELVAAGNDPFGALRSGENTIRIRNSGAVSIRITSLVLEVTYP